MHNKLSMGTYREICTALACLRFFYIRLLYDKFRVVRYSFSLLALSRDITLHNILCYNIIYGCTGMKPRGRAIKTSPSSTSHSLATII